MKKITINMILFFLLIFSADLKSQTIDDVLKTIESNNQNILAAQKLVESKTYEYRSMVLPEGPSFSYGYFPDNSTVTGPKETFEISQSVQMPCFYRNQSSLSRSLVEQERLSYQQFRQSVLSEAKKLLIESVFLTKMRLILQARLSDAENLFTAFTKRLENGDVNVLEVNKAKLHLLTIQNQLKTIHTQLNSLQLQLNYMNGGQELNVILTEYPVIQEIDYEQLKNEKQSIDPALLAAKMQIESSAKQLKVTKNMQLPSFSLGYAGETVVDERFRGFVVGMSIPIWGARSEIKKANYESQYIILNSQMIESRILSELDQQIEKAKTLKENLKNYSVAIESVNNLELLKKSLDLGEISSIEYFTEISYFYQVYDDYIVAEKDYQLEMNGLLKYKL
ncbi:MAG: TolC family protein [Bacteroidales bacterium]